MCAFERNLVELKSINFGLFYFQMYWNKFDNAYVTFPRFIKNFGSRVKKKKLFKLLFSQDRNNYK